VLLIQRLRRILGEVERMPALCHLGFLLMAVGLVASILVAIGGAPHQHPGHALPLGHLVALLGMALALAGVAIDGARRQRSARRSRAAQGGSTHATR
jgi:hypothetical protein